MPPHALDLPEILSLVGSFLPIWVEKLKYRYLHDPDFLLFKPVSLCRCLRVSRLWHDTLLPILWHGYWTCNSTMKRVPLQIIDRHYHHLKTLQLRSSDFFHLESALLGCTNLVQLSIEYCTDNRVDGKTRLTESQLLRSNPLLKKFSWTSHRTKNDSRLMPQDFVGLNHLESLHLSYWNCSDGQLAGVLSAVSRTLKEFKFGANNNLSLGSLALPQEERSPGKDLGIVNADQNVLRLGRLEKLSWNSKGITFDCAIELVKSCPNLKALELSRQMLVSLDDIAESLRMHCLHLESVTIVFAAKLAHFRNFSRRCSISGLRTLDITSRVPDDDLLSGILYHASTLEDLRVSRSLNGKNPRIFLPLLVECTKLKRFAINFTFLHSDTDPLEALSQKRWGCRGLEKLDLQLPFLDSRRVLTMESEQEFKRITFAAGWEMVPLSYRYFMCKTTHLPKVFELLEDQKLVRLRSLVLDDIPLRRIAHRIKQID